jgi:hypothetical protein
MRSRYSAYATDEFDYLWRTWHPRTRPEKMPSEGGLEWIGLDLNIDPAPFWRLADPPGKGELAYCRGLYRLLDELRRAHPGLIIENSAAGGRRVDLGMLRRTHLNWLSDQTFTPDICRYMQCRWNSFLPGHLANSAVAVPLGSGLRTCHGHPRPKLSSIAGWKSTDTPPTHTLSGTTLE